MWVINKYLLSKDTNFLGVVLFLTFFIVTPLLLKIKVTSNIFVEPLVPILFSSSVVLIWGLMRKKGFQPSLKHLKKQALDNKIITLYIFLLFTLFISYVYGIFLTEFQSFIDLLKIVKFALYFSIFPLAIYTANVLSRDKIRRVLLIFASVGIFTALFTLARIITNIESGGVNDFWQYSPDVKAVGFLGQYFDPLTLSIGQISKGANGTYGLYLSVIICILLTFLTLTKRFTKEWWFYVFGIVITFGAILYTLSRSTFLTIGFIFSAWLIYILKDKILNIAVYLVLGLLIFETGTLATINPQLLAKINSSVAISETEGGGGSSGGGGTGSIDVKIDSSSYGRVEQWKATFNTFKESPIFSVTGIGYSRENLQHFVDGGLSSSHSLFLDMWVRGSIVALGVMIAIWYYLFKTTVSFWKSKEQFIQIFGVVLFGFMIGWFIDNLISGEQFFSDAVMLAFWGTFGFLYALNEKRAESAKLSKKR